MGPLIPLFKMMSGLDFKVRVDVPTLLGYALLSQLLANNVTIIHEPNTLLPCRYYLVRRTSSIVNDVI